MGVQYPNPGFEAGPNMALDFGLGGPNPPGFAWDTRNGSTPGGKLNYGVPPESHGHISQKQRETVTYTYLNPPIGDYSFRLTMPEMICFTVHYCDPDENSTLVLTLPKLNWLMAEAWNNFEIRTSGTPQVNPNYDQHFVEFRDLLQEYGERVLEGYAYLRSHNFDPNLSRFNGRIDAVGLDKLQRFYDMALEDDFIYLTKFGIQTRISLAGVVQTVNRAIGLETEDRTENSDHYEQVVVAVAKFVRVANVFGPTEEITTGSRVWLTLTRKQLREPGKYGPFMFKPGGSKTMSRPLSADTAYLDESGALCYGRVFPLGVVIEPDAYSPMPAALEQATCTALTRNAERAAYECHATLPKIAVQWGTKI